MKRISIIAGAVALIAAAVLVGCNLFSAGLSVIGPSGNIAYNGTYHWGAATGTQTFTIKNTGSNTLTLTGAPSYVQVSPGTSGFSVGQQAGSSSLAVNATTTFTINGTGTMSTATVSIANNSGQNPFTFTITSP